MGDKLEDVAVEYLYKHWERVDFTLSIVGNETSLTQEDKKGKFFKGLTLNIDRIKTDEEWAKYVVGRVYRNRKKNFYEECIHWLMIDVYRVDMTTTKESLYRKVYEDIKEVRGSIKSE